MAIKNVFKLKNGNSKLVERNFNSYLMMFKSSYPNYSSQIDNLINEIKTVMSDEVGIIKILNKLFMVKFFYLSSNMLCISKTYKTFVQE